MRPFLIICAIVIAIMVVCCEVEGAPRGYTCGPNGCGPAVASSGGCSSGSCGSSRFGGRLLARRPVRRLLSIPFRLVGRIRGR